MPLKTAKKCKEHNCSLDFDLFFGGKRKTYVMGILNRTPDSFSDGGLFFDEDSAVTRCLRMIDEGADIIDIGGESTRPGAKPVSVDEELRRVIPLVSRISKIRDIPISIDTYKSEVAREAVLAGASIINDVTALRADPKMGSIAAEYGACVILMHMKGAPLTMQENPVYDNIVKEIIDFLAESIEIAKKAGVAENKIAIDPGIGFGKTLEHNLKIIYKLSEFKALGKTIAIGTSRKSFIGKILNVKEDERLIGSLVTAAIAAYNGASIIRTHDVKESKQVASIVDAVANSRKDV